MTDGSSTYNDMWFSDTEVFITGSTAGAVNIHRYRVVLTLQTPSGGSFTSIPPYSSISGYVSNSLSASWTAGDLGADFLGTSRHDFWCTASGLTPVILFAQLRRRPAPPAYQCTAGTTNVCSDASNGIAPLGVLKRSSCKKWNYCCDASNKYSSGWCREETCFKTSGQSQDPVASQCMSQTACESNINGLCLGIP